MARVDARNKTIHAKLVYYGPGMCGKTTNLEYVNSKLATRQLMSLATEGDRTIFFDFMPLDLGKLWGMTVSFKLYTVPGQVRYNQTRKMVLKNVDGVVFVADSQRRMLDANLESLDNLFSNLKELNIDHSALAITLQYNKRDLPDLLSQEELDRALNGPGYPTFLASAMTGQGVTETLKASCAEVLHRLKKSMGEGAPEKAPYPKSPSSSKNPTLAGVKAPPPPIPETKAAAEPTRSAWEAAATVPPTPEAQRVSSSETARIAAGGGAAPQARAAAEAPVVQTRIAPVASAAAAANAAAPGTNDRTRATAARAASAPTLAGPAAAAAPPEPAQPSTSESSDRLVPVIVGRLDRVQQLLSEQHAVLSGDPEKLAKLSAKLDELGASVLKALGGGLASKADLDALRAEVSSVAAVARELKSALGHKGEFEKIHDSLARLAAKPAASGGAPVVAEGLSSKAIVDALKAEFAGLPRRAELEALVKVGTPAGAKGGPDVSALEKRLLELPTKADLAAVAKQGAPGGAAPNKQELDALHKRLDELPSKKELDALKAALAGLPSKQELDALHKRLDELPSKKELDALKATLGGLPTKADLQARPAAAASATDGTALAAVQRRLAELPAKADLEALQAALARLPSKADLEQLSRSVPASAASAAVPAPIVEAPKSKAEPETETESKAETESKSEAEAAAAKPAAAEPEASAPAAPTEAAPQETAAVAPTATEAAAKPSAEPPAEAPSEAQPEAPAPAASEAEKPDMSNDPEHQNAARAARVMVSDLLLYQKDEVDNGIREGDFFERNKEALADMKATYETRIPKHVRDHKDYLKEAIDAFIAKRRTRLGLG